jgi:hypothetical protein
VLNVGGEAKRSQRLSVTDNPRTIILTDWNALYAEFLDTGMQPGWEDRNNNGLHDFFELVERVRTYAEAHEGIVMDLSVVFPDDHFDYSSFDARKQRGMDMDRVIEAVCTRSQEYGATGCQNVVIVGSDQVVPFYRVFDPLNSYNFADRSFDPYGTHSLERGEHGNHPLLQDLGQGYLPSDLPYSIQAFQEITPDSWRSLEAVGKKEHWPRPDIGIGRIFAPTPYDLVAAIDRYETPIFLSQDKARASILIGSTDVLGHADFDVGQGQFASKLFGRFANRLKIPASGSWNQADFVQALRADDLVSAWGHGNYASIGIEASDPLTADSLKHLWRDGPLAFTAMACHSGLSMSNYPDGERAEPFAKSLVNSLVAQGITMFAPGGIAYSFEKKGLRQGSTILHPLRVERFTTALLEQETVGQAWVESLRDYFDSDPANLELRNEAVNLFHLNGAYGMILYGLPTQPLQQEGEKGEASHISCQPVLAPAGAATRATTDEPVDSFVLTLDIPHLTRQEDEEGGITFGLPHEGGQTGVPGGPVLPVLVRSFVLPDHLALKDIMLLDATVEDIRETVSDITLTNVPVVAEVVSEDGTVLHSTGETYELPAVYPEIPYGYVPPRAGSRLITIAAIPLQYEKETRTTTLYRRMRFKVSVVPDTDIQEAPGAIVTIPEGQVVYGNRYPQPVTVEVAHDLSDNLTLHWTISDREGSVVKSGQHFLTREYRHHVCTLNLNTQDWIPGSKDVVVSLQRGMTVLQSASVTVTVKGISMEGSLEAPPVSTPGWRATLRLHLYREGGEPLVGLDASAFTLSIMDHQGVVHFITPEGLEPLVAVEGTNSNDRRNGSVVNDGTGGYILRFSPPPGVRGDQNRLQVKVAIPGEGTEIVGTRTWSLAIPSSSVYLPLVVR